MFGLFWAVRCLIWNFFNQFMAELIGPRLYSCSNCRNHVSLHDDIISKAFHVNHLSLSVFHFSGWFWRLNFFTRLILFLHFLCTWYFFFFTAGFFAVFDGLLPIENSPSWTAFLPFYLPPLEVIQRVRSWLNLMISGGTITIASLQCFVMKKGVVEKF